MRGKIMQIDGALLTKLEKLSHLKIANEKKEEVMGQLSDILQYVENLNELNTDGLEGRFSTLEGGTPLREDTAHSDTEVSQSILSNAPKSEDDFFIVPAIIE
jgi:aspartyl-tRNA(Asn)/glutamyl-tRNA(Gln) amidotransferase subunit C